MAGCRLHYPGVNVRNRRLRRAAACLRGRHGCAAPDGVPRLRLVGNRTGRRRRGADRVPPRRSAGQPGGGRRADAAAVAERHHRPGPHPLGHPRAPHRPKRAPAPRCLRQDRRRPQRHHRELSAACATSWRPRAWNSPATPTPRSRCTWWRGHTRTATTAGDFVASVLAVLRRLEGHFTLVFTHADDPAPSSPPAARHRWWSVSARARCSSAPTSPRSSSTPATPSNSARTRPW